MTRPGLLEPQRGHDGRHGDDGRRAAARRVVAEGLVGGLPGLLVVMVPLLLHELDVITSDHAQIGFVGVPMLFVGILVGALDGASRSRCMGAVGLGVVAGFACGTVIGLTVGPGAWLFLAALAMLVGGATGARLRGRADPVEGAGRSVSDGTGIDRRAGGHDRSSDRNGRRPARSRWLLPAIVAVGWGGFIAALAIAARLFASDGDRPTWGEVMAVTAYNVALAFAVGVAVSMVVRAVSRDRAVRDAGEGTPSPRTAGTTGIWAWTMRGHPVMPTTTEGRLALALSALSIVPFVAGPAMLAAPVLFVLAVRRGDRGLLLIVPFLVGLFLVFFVVAEFTIGHD